MKEWKQIASASGSSGKNVFANTAVGCCCVVFRNCKQDSFQARSPVTLLFGMWLTLRLADTIEKNSLPFKHFTVLLCYLSFPICVLILTSEVQRGHISVWLKRGETFHTEWMVYTVQAIWLRTFSQYYCVERQCSSREDWAWQTIKLALTFTGSTHFYNSLEFLNKTVLLESNVFVCVCSCVMCMVVCVGNSERCMNCLVDEFGMFSLEDWYLNQDLFLEVRWSGLLSHT